VLEDKRCMYCHQQLDSVFFTRYMGDFTARPGDFGELQVRAAALYKGPGGGRGCGVCRAWFQGS